VLTCRWRAAGEPIERVLVRVKSLTRAADAAGDWRDWRDSHGPLMPRVVRWTIETYYDRTPRHAVPPAS
jgi:hypothetical protein